MTVSYNGPLKEPLEPMRRPSLTDDPEQFFLAELSRIKRDRLVKLGALLDVHGIRRDDPDWESKLLWSMIEAHVPGFKFPIARRRGKPLKHSVPAKLALIAAVARLRLDGQRSVKSACEILCGSDEYRGDEPGSLTRRYSEALEMPFAVMLQNLGLTLDRPDLWEQMAEAFQDTPEIEKFNKNDKRK